MKTKIITYSMFFLISMSSLSFANIESRTGTINFDVQGDQQAEATLNSIGLGIGGVPTAKLHVNGNAIVSENLYVSTDTGSSNLNLKGNVEIEPISVYSDSSLGDHHIVLADSSSDNISLTLPDPLAYQGRIHEVKKVSSSNEVTILTASGNIDGSETVTLIEDALGTLRVISSGDRWHVLSVTDGVVSWDPSLVSPEAWYDASDAASVSDVGGALSQWSDRSENNRDFDNITGTPTLESNSEIDFIDEEISGGSDLSFGINDTFMVIMCMSLDNTDTTFIFGTGGPGGSEWGYSMFYQGGLRFMLRTTNNDVSNNTSLITPTLNNTFIAIMTFDGNANKNSVKIFVNGTDGTAVIGSSALTGDFGTSRPLGFSHVWTSSLEAKVHEAIVLSSDDSDVREKVEGYLAHKWGLVGELPVVHPYKNISP